MRLKRKNKTKINKLVFQGKLPLAFYGSEIIELHPYDRRDINEKKFIPKYGQLNIARAAPNKCISKVYGLF